MKLAKLSYEERQKKHLTCLGDACFIKYCRDKKATEKLEIHAKYKVLRNEIKMKTKQAKKQYYQDSFGKNKTDLSKIVGSYSLYCQCGKKKRQLKHNGTLLFNPVQHFLYKYWTKHCKTNS